MNKSRQEGRDRIRQVLTPEQGPKFEDLLLQMDGTPQQAAEAQGH